MKALHVHAHHDDFEFCAAGTFERWRRQHGAGFQGRIVVCTDGAAGHHIRTRAETAALRHREQETAAALGGLEYQRLVDPAGQPFREGCLQADRSFLAALWRTIRDFEPDYLFCPPLPTDPLAGVHPDHLAVAEGIRRVAYLINVPHAFTPEYPADEPRSVPCRTPVILHVHDGYMAGANAYDLAVPVEPVFDHLVETSWCHQSQIAEWLPWVDRHQVEAPASKAHWAEQLRRRCGRINRELGWPGNEAHEFFRVTAWGTVPDAARLLRDFPDGTVAAPTLVPALARWTPPVG